MPDIVCLEWAVAAEAQPALQDIVTATAADRIVFPHVDTCCAFIFLMSDGTAIGGHASMIPPNQNDPDLRGAADDMLARMYAVAGSAPTHIIYIAEANWAQAAPAAQQANANLRLCQATNYCGWVTTTSDFFLDLPRRRLQAQNWDKTAVRAATAIPAMRANLTLDRALPALQRTNQGPAFCVLL